MQKYSIIIEEYLVKIMKELFTYIKAGYYGNDFETIRMNREFKMFYMILEEMNIIGIKNRSPDITRYCEKGFNVFKAFIVGIELLGKTLDKFECILSKSSIIIRKPNENFEALNPLVKSTLRDNSRARIEKNTLESLPAQYNIMLNYYKTFCEILFDLDIHMKLKCMTAKGNDFNMENIEIICKKMNSFLLKLLAEPENKTFYEGKCTLLKVFVELRDCIYQSINMKSECSIGTLKFATYEENEEDPIYNDQEKPCLKLVKAELFLKKLKSIKTFVTKTKIKKLNSDSIVDIHKTLSDSQLFALVDCDFFSNEMEVDVPSDTIKD